MINIWYPFTSVELQLIAQCICATAWLSEWSKKLSYFIKNYNDVLGFISTVIKPLQNSFLNANLDFHINIVHIVVWLSKVLSMVYSAAFESYAARRSPPKNPKYNFFWKKTALVKWTKLQTILFFLDQKPWFCLTLFSDHLFIQDG